MPREVYGRDFAFLPRAELLTFEEITRLTRLFARLGVKKLRLTGGEPLLRRDLPTLVAMLGEIDGIEDITLTTNGSLLARQAQGLADAGLKRISVSLDSLDETTFARMNDVGFPVSAVLAGIAAAHDAGLTPIKVNMVVRRGVNEDSVVPMARYFRERGHILRFIEYMDVGHTNGWRLDDVVPAGEILARIDAEMPLVSLTPNYPGEVADRWAYRDGTRRSWRNRLRYPAFLRRLLPRAPDGRRPVVHVPLLKHGARPPRRAARGRLRPRPDRDDWLRLARARRPIFGTANPGNGAAGCCFDRPEPRGDVADRRLTSRRDRAIATITEK